LNLYIFIEYASLYIYEVKLRVRMFYAMARKCSKIQFR